MTQRLSRIPQFARLALMTAAAVAGPYSSAQATTLYSFTGGSDGNQPRSGVIQINGSFYGTTFYGGTSSCSDGGIPGCGVVFKLSPAAGGSWHETVLHNFTFASGDGAYPEGLLTSDANNNLYGTAGGGINSCNFYGCGVVFELKPASGGSYTETILYSFQGASDGYAPRTGVIFGTDGGLYGTTTLAGEPGTGCGTVFRLGPPSVGGGPWSFSVLYTFTNSSDGCYPQGLVFGANGALYGTTQNTVFELAPPAMAGQSWRFTTLHTFSGSTDGYSPGGGVVYGVGGALYGSTSDGGTLSGGTVFQVAPPITGGTTWTETVLYNFPFTTGPIGNLALGANGLLVGTTLGGGVACDKLNHPDRCGMVFSLRPPTVVGANWTYGLIHNFTATGGDGGQPEAGVFLSTKGQIYGTTTVGGTGTATCSSGFVPGCGTVFMFNP